MIMRQQQQQQNSFSGDPKCFTVKGELLQTLTMYHTHVRPSATDYCLDAISLKPCSALFTSPYESHFRNIKFWGKTIFLKTDAAAPYSVLGAKLNFSGEDPGPKITERRMWELSLSGPAWSDYPFNRGVTGVATENNTHTHTLQNIVPVSNLLSVSNTLPVCCIPGWA